MPIHCHIHLSVVGSGSKYINTIVLLLSRPLCTPQNIISRWTECRYEVWGSRTNSKGVEFGVDMQLLGLFHGGDCFILMTRAKNHIRYRLIWSRGFERGQDTCEIGSARWILLIIGDFEILACGIIFCSSSDLLRERIISRDDSHV